MITAGADKHMIADKPYWPPKGSRRLLAPQLIV